MNSGLFTFFSNTVVRLRGRFVVAAIVVVASMSIGLVFSPNASAADYAPSDAGINWWCTQYTDRYSMGDYLTVSAMDGSGVARAEVGAQWVDIRISARMKYCNQPATSSLLINPRGVNISGHAGTILGSGPTTIWYPNNGTGNIQQSAAITRPLYIGSAGTGCFTVYLQFATAADGTGFNIYPTPQSGVNLCLQRFTTYTLTPSITSIPRATEPGRQVAVTGTVSKTGTASSTSPTNTYYTRIVHKISRGQSTPANAGGGVQAVNGCQYYGMTGTNASRCSMYSGSSSTRPTFTNYAFTGSGRAMPQFPDTADDDLDVGDRICYGLSVSGYNNTTGPGKTTTRHSALRCVVVGKKPKVHVTGGDVLVRGTTGSASNIVTGVTERKKVEDTEIDAPASSFSGLWRTGVNNAGGKLTNNAFDEHWIIDRAYNAMGTNTCQYANIGPPGSLNQFKIPTTSSSYPIRARVVVESGGWAGQYTTNTYFGGNLVIPAVLSLNGQSVWNRVSSKASWIGQNHFGQNYTSVSCNDPTTYANNIERANVYVFKLRNGFRIDDPDVKLDTARIHIAGAVDNEVMFYVNGTSLGPWQAPGWTPSSRATSGTRAGVFNYGHNDLEVHIRSTYSHTGLLIDEIEVQAKKILRSDEPNIFGSWSEYAAVANGGVEGFSSAAGYAGGTRESSFCSLSLLTFSNRSNADVCVDSQMGRYTLPASVRTVVDRYASQTGSNPGMSFAPASLASGVYKPTGSGQITLRAGEMQAGRSVVIYAPNNDIVIEGNLTYTAASLSGIGRIPQLVIIGRNITVNEGVSRVNAWLVAKTTDHGNLYTCSRVFTELRTNRCSTRLEVNGPVIVNRLHLLRTAGAGAGDDAVSPAEVFNLRPDAYLWGISQSSSSGRIPTVMTTELPPRF